MPTIVDMRPSTNTFRHATLIVIWLVVDHNTWLIAAPYDTMENNIRIEIFSKAEEDRKRRLEDPIVFRATKIGIVIVSMWGEEASDSMFDKYR